MRLTTVTTHPYELPAVLRSRRAWFVAGLGAGAFLLRIPFREPLLSSFDGVNYTLALSQFDMRLGQPQAPGYPLYVVLGRVFAWGLQVLGAGWQPVLALDLVSMLFGALAVCALYQAGRDLFGERVGWFTALIAATSAVVWYMSEIAAPYAPDLFASAIGGWLCWRVWNSPAPRWAWLAALGVGLAGALRLQTLVFLFPLFLGALLWGPVRSGRWLRLLGAVGLALAVLGLFLIPAVLLSGGLRGFSGSLVWMVPLLRDTQTISRTTRWARFAANGWKIANYTLRILGEPALLLALVGAAGLAAGLRRAAPKDLRPFFLLAWLLPSWLVYFVIWPGNIGTLLVSMPPLFLLAGAGLERAWSAFGRGWGGAILGLLLVWNGLVFLALPENPLGGRYRLFDNYAHLRRVGDDYRAQLGLVASLPVEGTLVYADDFRHMQYYLPQYHTFTLPRFSKIDPELVKVILSMEDGRMKPWKDVPAAQLIPAGTQRVAYFDAPDAFPCRFVCDPQGLGRVEEFKKDPGPYSDPVYLVVVSFPPAVRARWTPQGLVLEPGVAAQPTSAAGAHDGPGWHE